MVKCPFCQFENEEGALFCEQCKSDLGANEAAPLAATAVAEPAIPLAMVAEAVAVERVQPVTPIPEAFPLTAEAVLQAPEAAPVAMASSPTQAVGTPLPPGAQPKLVVIRGIKVNMEYPLYEGENFLGRTDEKPVDIDLEDQEPPDRIWSSRQHACICVENGNLTIEDLNSSNGTFVNRTRVHPGQKRPLNVNDVVQIGTVQLKVRA